MDRCSRTSETACKCRFSKTTVTGARRKQAVKPGALHPFHYRRELLETCERLGVVLQSFSPLEQGRALGEPTVVTVARRVDRTPAQVLLRWGQKRPDLRLRARRRRDADTRRARPHRRNRARPLVHASVSSGHAASSRSGVVNDSVPPDERPALLDGAEAAVTFATGTGANDVSNSTPARAPASISSREGRTDRSPAPRLRRAGCRESAAARHREWAPTAPRTRRTAAPKGGCPGRRRTCPYGSRSTRDARGSSRTAPTRTPRRTTSRRRYPVSRHAACPRPRRSGTTPAPDAPAPKRPYHSAAGNVGSGSSSRGRAAC